MIKSMYDVMCCPAKYLGPKANALPVVIDKPAVLE